jgi:hypothetical protein
MKRRERDRQTVGCTKLFNDELHNLPLITSVIISTKYYINERTGMSHRGCPICPGEMGSANRNVAKEIKHLYGRLKK